MISQIGSIAISLAGGLIFSSFIFLCLYKFRNDKTYLDISERSILSTCYCIFLAFFYVYQNQDSVKVYYYGIRPDLFTDDAEVVVSGSFSNNLITAKELQTKCASRYEGDLKNVEKI